VLPGTAVRSFFKAIHENIALISKEGFSIILDMDVVTFLFCGED
jgi:hypothetical protein